MTPETVSGSDSNSNDCNDDSNKKLPGFRIRNVNEINCAVGSEESTSGNDLKRKLPNWLQSPEDVNKKAKRKQPIRRAADPCTSTQSDGNNCSEGNDTTAASTNMNSEPEVNVVTVQEPESEQPDTSNELEENNCPDKEVTHQVSAAEEGDTENKNEAQSSRSDNCDEIKPADIEGGGPSHEEEKDIKPEVNVPTKYAQPDISEAESSHPDSNDVTSNAQQTDSNEADGREVKVKVEDGASSTSTSVKQPTASPVVKQEASSSLRDSCQYGIRCYRRNPAHRSELAHPGDQDYRRPNFPTPPLGTPDCPYGNLCYRRNPVHFQQYTHPDSTDFKKNWRDHKNRLRKRQNKVKNNVDLSDDDDYDLDDPFINDGSDDEYVPSDDDSDSESSLV